MGHAVEPAFTEKLGVREEKSLQFVPSGFLHFSAGDTHTKKKKKWFVLYWSVGGVRMCTVVSTQTTLKSL